MQYDADIVNEFDVGYIYNNTVCKPEEFPRYSRRMGSVLRGNSATLWCNSLRKLEAQCGNLLRACYQEDSDNNIEVQTKKKESSIAMDYPESTNFPYKLFPNNTLIPSYYLTVAVNVQ